MEFNKEQKRLIFVIALLIVSVFSIAMFGIKVFYLLLASIGASFVVELAFVYFRKKPIEVTRWLITPMIIVLFLPLATPIWMAAVTTAFAVFFGSALFGGEDNYLFVPAMLGVVFVTISFPIHMTTMWSGPGSLSALTPQNTATILKAGGVLNIKDLLMGNSVGSIGEGFRLLLILLGLGLMALKVVDWKVPTFYLGSYFLFTTFGKMVGIEGVMDPVNSLFVGTVILTAFFVAVDEPTMAQYPLGKILYGIGLGLFTFLVRTFSNYSDGTMFVILIMNALAPLIDKIEAPKVIEEDDTLEEGVIA